MSTTQRPMLVIFALATLAGCDPASKAWEQAQNQNTIETFEQYISEFPDSEYAAEAVGKIDALVWRQTESLDNENGYEAYISDYPSGAFVAMAKNRLREIRLDSVLSDFDKHLMAFMRDEPSEITSVRGKSWKELDPRVALESGGFDSYHGQAIIRPGSVVVFVDREDMFHIRCGIDEAQYANYAKPDTFDSAKFMPGVTVGLKNGEILTYSEEGWTYSD